MKLKNILISFLSGAVIALAFVVALFSKKAGEAIKIKVRGRNNSVNLLRNKKHEKDNLITRIRNKRNLKRSKRRDKPPRRQRPDS